MPYNGISAHQNQHSEYFYQECCQTGGYKMHQYGALKSEDLQAYLLG